MTIAGGRASRGCAPLPRGAQERHERSAKSRPHPRTTLS